MMKRLIFLNFNKFKYFDVHLEVKPPQTILTKESSRSAFFKNVTHLGQSVCVTDACVHN